MSVPRGVSVLGVRGGECLLPGGLLWGGSAAGGWVSAAGGAVSAAGGWVSVGGVCSRGYGVVSQYTLRQTSPPPTCGQNDKLE